MTSHPQTFIIAEAGVNHNGDLDKALQLIDQAANAGANCVKFQTFKSEHLVSKQAATAHYQQRNTEGAEQSQLEMLKKYELDLSAHQTLVSHCKNRNIAFLSTPFDLDSADLLLNDLKLNLIKIPSGEITNGPLLLKIAQKGVRIILSSGMSTLADVEMALSVIAHGYLHGNRMPTRDTLMQAYASTEGQRLLQERVTLLHCTTQYPTPFADVNLKAMDTLAHAFGLKVGLSDHTQGIAISTAAVARGAAVIEKHFTLNRNLPGPDHKASLEPDELSALVQAIRQVEQALGRHLKAAAISEVENLVVARKCLVAATRIKQGDIWTLSNLTAKRTSQSGKTPMQFWELLGQSATRDYTEDEVID